MNDPHFEHLLARSSLGTPAVRQLAARTPVHITTRLLPKGPTTMPTDRPNRRIVQPNPDGGWDVTARGAQHASAHTQADAINRARQIVTNLGGGELEIRGRNGRIRNVDTIPNGNDPHPPRG